MSRARPLVVAAYLLPIALMSRTPAAAQTGPIGTWERLPPALVPVRAAAAVAVDDRIYLIGGAEASRIRSRAVQIFDPATGQWSRGPDAPFGLDLHTAAVVGGRIHVISGSREDGTGQRDHWVLDPRRGFWAQAPSIPIAVNAATTQVVDGRIHVFGGAVGEDYRMIVQIYDPRSETWSFGGELPIGTLGAVSAVLDGRVHLIGGGTSGSATTRQHLIYDVQRRSFAQALFYPREMEAGGGGVVDDAVCVFGGRLAAPGRRSAPFGDGHCWVDGEWLALPTMPTPRAEIAYATHDGMVYAMGGVVGQSVSDVVERLVPFGTNAAPYVLSPSTPARTPAPRPVGNAGNLCRSPFVGLDPRPVEAPQERDIGSIERSTAGRWETLRPMPIAVRSPAVASDGNRIYVVGGSQADASKVDAVQILDLSTMRWSLGAPAPEALDFATAAYVDGNIHLISGATASGSQCAHWALNLGTNTWTARAPIPAATNAATTVVIGGRIVTIGGSQGGRPLLDDVQVYDVVEDTWSQGPELPMPRLSAAAAVMEGAIHLVGGAATNLVTLDQHLVLDLDEQTFVERAPYPVAREAGGAGVLEDHLCVFGGRVARSGRSNQPDGRTFCYRPWLDSWVMMPSMGTPRAEIGYVTVGGYIYALGGDGASGPTNAVERFSRAP